MKKCLLLIFLALILPMSGCVEEEQISSNEDIELATSLMSSGETLIEEIDVDSPTDARNRLYAAKVSYEEALEILDSTTTENEDEKKIIEVNKIICNYYLESIEAQEELIDCYDHLYKARAYIAISDYDNAREELTKFNGAIDSATPNFKNAKEISDQINMDEVPLELKPILIFDRENVYVGLDLISEYQDLKISLSSQIDGSESFEKALEHMDNEEWEEAESMFEFSVSNMTRSRDILMDLQDSGYSEIAVPAIESCSLLDITITFADHCGKGCGYMNNDNYNKADEEFELALEALE